MNIRILFFGAGKLGKHWITCFRDWGMVPQGILDNNKDLWGSLWEGVLVYDPSMLETFNFDYIFITCKREAEIYRQLLELGVAKNKIIVGNHNILNHLLFYAVKEMAPSVGLTKGRDDIGKRKVLFDLYNGMILGGVESWSYALAKSLCEKGYEGLYLTRDVTTSMVIDETYPVFMLENHKIHCDKDKIDTYVMKIINNLPCTVICNFPQYIFWSACIVKRLYTDQIRIIAVQHSDESLYYSTYNLWEEYVDCFLVISSRMEQRILSEKIDRNKINRLEWEIPCDRNLDREWGEKKIYLQIGYAGRVTISQKRVDLFLELALKLKEKGIRFLLNIAGTGNYYEKLCERVQEEGLQDCIVCVGCIDRKNIPNFWKKQDIMISCSEYEGHSISQSEAMAEGAVPVITDVSGARDDVTDGYNGYVVDVGDIDALADRIQKLYLDRTKLKQMSIRAHDTICKRQKDMDQTVFWDDLIGKVWQA